MWLALQNHAALLASGTKGTSLRHDDEPGEKRNQSASFRLEEDFVVEPRIVAGELFLFSSI